MSDDIGIAKFARTWRKEAVAALVAIIRDDDAPASARASAAEKILHYSDGRPTTAQPLTTVADLSGLSQSEKAAIYTALTEEFLTHGWPPAIEQMFQDAAEEDEDLSAPPIAPPVSYPRNRLTRIRLRTDIDDDEPKLIRRRISLIDSDDDIDQQTQAPRPGSRPVPGPGEYLIELPHFLNVIVPGGGSVSLKKGFQLVTEEVARHPIIRRFVIEEALTV